MIENYNKNNLAPALAASHLEVYLFYQNVNKTDKKGNFNDFFAQLNQLDETLADAIVFLEMDSVWQYSRFMGNHHTVLKVYLPQTAIEGRSHGLTLKKGFITKANIQGCFPSWAKGLVYVKNPFFAEDLMDNTGSAKQLF